MSAADVSKLRLMKDSVDDQVDGIQTSIDQIQDQITENTEQADAISNAMMDPAADRLEGYLTGKAIEYQYPTLTFVGLWEEGGTYSVDDIVTNPMTYDNYVCILGNTGSEANEPGVGASWTTYWVAPGALTDFQVYIGPAYNVTNITDWAIQEWTFVIPVPPPILPGAFQWVNIYVYLGVGWDGDTTIIEMQDDWDFGLDYLNQPLGTGSIPSSYGLLPKISSLNSAKTIVTNNQSKVAASKDVFDRYLEE